MPKVSSFIFDFAAQRFRDIKSGRFLSIPATEKARERVINGARQEMERDAQRLVEGKIKLAEFERRMQRNIKTIHVTTAAQARGGFRQMTRADYDRVSKRVLDEFKYLRDFSKDVKSGRQALTGVRSRAGLYSEAARGTYWITASASHLDAGYSKERNVLGIAEHCSGRGSCLAETRRGWVSIGKLKPVGSRKCRSRDKCSVQYQ